MPVLKHIALYHFKNYEQHDVDTNAAIICLHGKNGSGKTNLLDAIHFLCLTKSYFIHSDALCVMKGKSGMRIQGVFQGDFQRDEDFKVTYILRESGKKEFKLDDLAYSKFSKHLGRIPCVFVTPDDTRLITDGSEERRKFLDMMIAQTDEGYVGNLIEYNKILQQRNALLKQWAQSLTSNESLMSIYEQQLHTLGHAIHNVRSKYCIRYKASVLKLYSFLSGGVDNAKIHYSSQLEMNRLDDLLLKNREKDIFSQRTNYGIHKDDLVFTLEDLPMKQVASQGQRKSFLFGLKLAQYELIKELSPNKPILLLDDIFEKLDENRSQWLIEYLLKQDVQIFITDTHQARLKSAFEGHAQMVKFINLNND